jgi:hypothetical protein
MATNEHQQLSTLLQLYQKNLYTLQEQAAAFGALNVPLALINQIDAEQAKIDRLQEKLSATVDSDSSPSSLNAVQTITAVMAKHEPRVIPRELYASFADRFALISVSQRRILLWIEEITQKQVAVTQSAIEDYLSKKYSKSEVYYRLEQLYLLGFLDRKPGGYDSRGLPRYEYSLSFEYRQERA